MGWKIQLQECGEEGYKVAKWISYFPITDERTGATTFGRLRNKVLRVLYRHEKATAEHDFWKICYTKHGFNVTCPKRLIKANTIPTCKEQKLVDGIAFGKGKAASGSMSAVKLEKFLKSQVGPEFAAKLLDALRTEIVLSLPIAA